MKSGTPLARSRSSWLIEALGWYGAAAVLAAYLLLSFNVLQPDQLSFQLLNGSGALALGFEAYRKKDYQPTALNAIWLAIAVIAIIRILTA